MIKDGLQTAFLVFLFHVGGAAWGRRDATNKRKLEEMG
jgi:hypothetical protein